MPGLWRLKPPPIGLTNLDRIHHASHTEAGEGSRANRPLLIGGLVLVLVLLAVASRIS
jgi:hypothetical protein